ncbi:50S ribosomal protein L6 [Membranicola marinus]|uniref:Large ribosomal subunit protein uL6 n=1 Tax=Membranihabitans marinus TaxID=1227546 RepID=A0A953HVN5_9BACT|nr:50S ribosomal protein L6 [Membranihabitans marinus]MBY5959315.1 50S ribosomal protein L6 [Membranihabitans marinus]
MSRIGYRVLEIPKDVKVEVSKGNMITVKGPKGELTQQIDPDMEVKTEDNTVSLVRPTEQKRHKALHGLYNALVHNMLVGVSEGYTKELELVGVGFRVNNTGNLLELTVGYSHPIMFYVPDEIKLETITEKGKNPRIVMESCNLELLGMIASKIRGFRKPEPYKGKGIRYKGEYIRRKAGKTAAK